MKQNFQRKDAEVQRREDVPGAARASARFIVRFHEGLKLPARVSFTVKRPEGRAPFNFASLPLCAFALNS
jgi:hypothetical protein